MSPRGRLVALMAAALVSACYDFSTRICAASSLLKLFDVKRLDELSAGAVPMAADAEKLYEAFAPCMGMNVLIQAFHRRWFD